MKLIKRIFIGFIFANLLSFLSAADSGKPNVVVMIVDDLGSGDVSCLFRDTVKTPNIDRIAAKGVKFTSGYVTASICGPSRAGFYTGQYQERFGFNNNSGGIPSNQTLLPGVLREAGYHTGLLGKWHSAGPMPFERGCFDETLCSRTSSPVIDYFHPRLSRNGKPEDFDEYSTDLFAEEAEKFIERNKDKPFALTVAFNAPHLIKVVQPAGNILAAFNAAASDGKILDVPKVPTARPGEAAKFAPQFPGDSSRADTVATITALDQAVGRILDKLEQLKLDRNTIVFFFSDNGAHPENRSENLPLRDYKWSVHDGGLRVPFLAAYPGVFPAGLTYSNPVCSFDIFPTVAALAGAKVPANLDGVDLTPYLTGKNPLPPHEALFFITSPSGDGAVREGDWKLVIPKRFGMPQLFNVTKDVSEKADLASVEPERVKAMVAKWETWNKTTAGPAESFPPSMRDNRQRRGQSGNEE